MSKFTESEDDPDPYESSGDEWKEDEKVKKRTSARLNSKPRKVHHDSSSEGTSGSESGGEVKVRKKTKNGINKKQKVSHSTSGAPKENNRKTDRSEGVISNTANNRKYMPKVISGNEYMTGTFVINKKDVQKGDPNCKPCIWRIDGKALLQKYEPYEEDGKWRHKNTSVYTGWSPMDKDMYSPVTVDVVGHSQNNLLVELHWDEIKKINYDSD